MYVACIIKLDVLLWYYSSLHEDITNPSYKVESGKMKNAWVLEPGFRCLLSESIKLHIHNHHNLEISILLKEKQHLPSIVNSVTTSPWCCPFMLTFKKFLTASLPGTEHLEASMLLNIGWLQVGGFVRVSSRKVSHLSERLPHGNPGGKRSS